MSARDFDTLALDLPDTDHFESELDRDEAGLKILVLMLIDELRVLKFGTPTQQHVSSLLSFIGPFGAGAHAFNAWCVLCHQEGDYEDFTGWVRRECRRAIASGRVKEAGQRRQRTGKVVPERQGDLFEGEPA